MKKLIVASFILVVSATPAQSQTAPDHPAVVVHGQTVHAAVDLDAEHGHERGPGEGVEAAPDHRQHLLRGYANAQFVPSKINASEFPFV